MNTRCAGTGPLRPGATWERTYPAPVDIAWHRRGPADHALRAHLTAVLGADPGEITLGRHCPACGSTAHGRPWAHLPDGTRPQVSLSRCGEHLVTVVADHRVGIDVESIAAVDARWNPDLVLHPSEDDRPLPRQVRAAMWCRKEAILKALGTGLRRPMSQIRCRDWPVEDIAAPPGLAAAVVVLDQAGSGGRSTA